MVKYLLFYYFLCSRISVLSLIFITKIDGSYLNPIPYIHYIIYIQTCFLYYFFSVYVNLSNNACSFSPHAAPLPDLSAKADAKVQTFRELPKHFTRKNQELKIFITFLILIKPFYSNTSSRFSVSKLSSTLPHGRKFFGISKESVGKYPKERSAKTFCI